MIKIIDLILIAIILICGWSGYKKGIIMGVGGILVILVSLFAANLVSNSFSYELVPVMRPFASGYLESTVTDEEEGVLVTMGYDADGYSLTDLVQEDPQLAKSICQEAYLRIGLAEDAASTLADEALDYAETNERDLLSSMAEVLCQRLAKVLCVTLAFLLILIILTVIGNLPNLSFKLPNLELVNDIGGAVLGVITGILFCILIAWCLRYLGLVFGVGKLDETWIASRLMSGNLFAKILGF